MGGRPLSTSCPPVAHLLLNSLNLGDRPDQNDLASKEIIDAFLQISTQPNPHSPFHTTNSSFAAKKAIGSMATSQRSIGLSVGGRRRFLKRLASQSPVPFIPADSPKEL
jgi:hypothetical protein